MNAKFLSFQTAYSLLYRKSLLNLYMKILSELRGCYIQSRDEAKKEHAPLPLVVNRRNDYANVPATVPLFRVFQTTAPLHCVPLRYTPYQRQTLMNSIIT